MLDTVIAWILIATGGGILTWSLVNFVYSLLSRRWPQATGKVIVSDLQRSRDSEGGYSYRPEVSYQYSVEGQEFIASRTRYGDRLALSWSAPAARMVRRYPVGAVVSVHYDPDEPAEAVLEPGVNGLILMGVALGVLFTSIGIVMLRSSS